MAEVYMMELRKKSKLSAISKVLGMLLFYGFIFIGLTAIDVRAEAVDGKALVEGLSREPDYYILEDSDKRDLVPKKVEMLSDNVRQMAINEIYARHGRKFTTPEIQEYFDEKSWYTGTVEPEEFDENILNEYEKNNIELLKVEPEYIFSDSDTRFLTEKDIERMSDEEIQLAINEIYARRGRKFDMAEYQEYFSQKSWYNGTIEPEDFDEAILNEYEKSNIEFLVENMGSAEISSFIGQVYKLYHAGSSEQWSTFYIIQSTRDPEIYMVDIERWDGTVSSYNGALEDERTYSGTNNSGEIYCVWSDPYTIEVTSFSGGYASAETYYDKSYWQFG